MASNMTYNTLLPLRTDAPPPKAAFADQTLITILACVSKPGAFSANDLSGYASPIVPQNKQVYALFRSEDSLSEEHVPFGGIGLSINVTLIIKQPRTACQPQIFC
jgi:hypothetical protein